MPSPTHLRTTLVLTLGTLFLAIAPCTSPTAMAQRGRRSEPPEPSGPPLDGMRAQRKERWAITFSYRDGKEYLRRLAELEAILAIPDGADKYLVIDDLNKLPLSARRQTTADINALNRIYWLQDDPEPLEALKDALALPDRPKYFWAFFPPDLEKAFLEAELGKSKLTEEQLNRDKWKSLFAAKRIDGKWKIDVIEQARGARPADK